MSDPRVFRCVDVDLPVPHPKTQCLHQERNTTCVSSCVSDSSVVGPVGGFSCPCNRGFFVVLHDGICLRSRGFQQSAQLVTRVVLSSAPSCGARSPHRLVANTSRTFDSHVSTRRIQQVSMVVSSQNRAPCGENTTVMPPSLAANETSFSP